MGERKWEEHTYPFMHTVFFSGQGVSSQLQRACCRESWAKDVVLLMFWKPVEFEAGMAAQVVAKPRERNKTEAKVVMITGWRNR